MHVDRLRFEASRVNFLAAGGARAASQDSISIDQHDLSEVVWHHPGKKLEHGLQYRIQVECLNERLVGAADDLSDLAQVDFLMVELRILDS